MAGGTAARDGRRPMRAVVAAIALTGSLAASLAGCSDDDPNPPPSSTSTAPPSTSAAPSPTATLPTAPPAEPTAESAEAFVRYFWDVYNYAYETQEAAPLETVSQPECKLCQSAIRDVKRLRGDGTRVEGARVVPKSVAAPPGKITSGVIVATVISQESGRSIQSDGSVHTLKAVAKRRSYVGVEWSDGKWSINGVTSEKPGETS